MALFKMPKKAKKKAKKKQKKNLHESNSWNYFHSGIDIRGDFHGLEQFQPPRTFVEGTT